MSEQDNRSNMQNSPTQQRPGRRGMGPMGGGGPMGGMGMPAQKAKNFKGTLKRLIGYLRPHRNRLLIVLILAVLSTTFTIAAPKIMAKGTNQLQNAYMARTMLKAMEKAQREAADSVAENMTKAQKTAVETIEEKMVEGQQTAVEQITTSMSDAQAKAVNAIYDVMAKQVYQGVLKGQKSAVDEITKQMGAAQKGLLAQINKQMEQMQQMLQLQKQMQASASAQQGAQQGTQQGQQAMPQGASVPQMDAKTLAAIQELQKLPLIDSLGTTKEKIDATIQFIDALQSLPAGIIPSGGQASGAMDVKKLASVKKVLEIPLLGNARSGEERADIIRKFMDLSGSMTGTGMSSGTSMQIEDETMDKILTRIPEIKDFSTDSNSSGTASKGEMTKQEQDAVNDLLKLPLLKDIQDPKEKSENLLKLIAIFKRLPELSGESSGTESGTQISTKDMDTVEELLKLPILSEIKDSDKKSATLIKMVDLFSSMPDMGTENSGSDKAMDPEQMKTVKKFLALPDLAAVTDEKMKSETVNEMLALFSSMPDMGNSGTEGTSEDNPAKNITSENVSDIQAFLKLPMLDTLTDAGQKADVCKQVIDLGKKLQSVMSGSSVNARNSIEYTDEQVEGVIKAIRETNGEYDFNYIGMIVLILIGMYLISSLFSLTMGLVMSGVAQNTVRDMRREVDGKLSRLPLKYFDLHAHGDILSRVTNDIDTVSGTLQQSLTQIITSVITIIGYIIMMLSINSILTLIVLASLPLYILATSTIAKKSQKYFAAQQKELGLLSGHVEEMYAGHKIVKAFGKEKDSIATFDGINEKLKDAGWKAQFVSGVMFPLMNFISNLAYVGISVVGGIWITRSILGIGDILAFIQYSRSFTMPIAQTANIANIIQSTIACAERVFEVLDEEEEIPDKADAVTLSNPRGEVRFEKVDFRYKEDEPLIENMNMDVKEGHTIAIVGPTGAGKTTLVNLLMRFYEINGGKISVDGVDIRDIKRSELRKMFGMVLQDTWLFNGTIRDNIAYGRENASMEEVVRAAKAAHADRFIRTLPEGYDTVLNEEATNISQGQKQLLTIARAILADPAILILDEATSSVDTRTEVLIQKAMTELMKDRTSFVIAHRLSTIRDAELILVMNKGSIIEMGNHKELLAKGGFYADIYNSQFTGANLENEAV